MNALQQLQFNLGRHPDHEAEADDVQPPGDPAVRLFAFYLPQFHPIPENDGWWGKGFTEWTNVTRALPRWDGHYQPHLPADLGFYDLRVVETLRQQVDLAKRYGIAGFCFHWYWFAGRRLLERPLEAFLENRDIDFPFFIDWANENWTRRWDGQDNTVLIRQHYSPEDDLAVADAFLAIMKDPRYLRVDGRPVLMVYRPSVMPDAAATTARWRAHFASRGEAQPLLLMAQTFNESGLQPGFDAVVQYPPHCIGALDDHPTARLDFFDGSKGGAQFDYASVGTHFPVREAADFPLFRSVCPGWDNEARKQNNALALVGSTPRRYARWLARAIRATLDERPLGTDILFINAWNEWAEGAHLEPDQHFGHAYLRQTCRTLDAARDPSLLAKIVDDGRPARPRAASDAASPSPSTAADAVAGDATAAASPDRNARGFVDAFRADRYDGHTDDPFEVAGMLRRWMPQRSRVLDIGCGTGSVTVIVNRYKKNDVTGIEPDAERASLAQARDVYVHCGVLDASFLRQHGRFDVVMMSDVLEHLPDPSTMLASVREALVPGGLLLISVPNVAHWSVRLSLLIGRFEYAQYGILDATHLRWFTAKTIQRLLRENGFDVLKIAQTAGQTLVEYQAAPWRWMPDRVRRNVVKLGARIFPLLFGCQHVVLCRLTEAPAAGTH